MTDVSSLTEAVTALGSTFTGQLLFPDDAGYNEARKVHNGLIDKRPALIARCRGLADIVDAVQMARNRRLEVAVRGGGHNVAGRATIDNGLMIDLSLMKGIHVDPKARTARAQGGLTWNEFNRETQLHGLATTGGVVSTTGIAGLTLGGGLGWLMSKHALALDNLLSVDVVLADGNVMTASADNNADLFWAMRGGGGGRLSAANLHQIYAQDLKQFALIQMNMGREVSRRLRESDNRLFSARMGTPVADIEHNFLAD
jgi:FAD/FMN-containing dehydrogenase